jgi:RsmE family RNA methyltransferase
VNLILFDSAELTLSGNMDGPETARGSLSRRDARAEHLLKVLRKKPGDTFDAGVLGGKLGTGIIEAAAPEGPRFSLVLDREPPPRIPLRLAVGFPRPIQLRRLLRDCANLGLAAVDLVGAELGEKSYRDAGLLRDGGARAALIEGAVQARDTRLPELAEYPSLALWLNARPWGTAGLQNGSGGTPDEAAGGLSKDAPLLAAADNVRPAGTFAGLGTRRPPAAVLAVGAERGWSNRERELLEAAGFLRLSLGKRALRTETACTAAAILLMEKMGLLG